VVRSGDTMWDIARAFGTSVDALRRLNYIGRSSRIYVGQKLKIPSSARNLKDKNVVTRSSPTYANTDKQSSTPKGSSQSEVKKYTVRAGDTLWDIARQFGCTTGQIRQLNGLGRSSRIYPGQVLNVAAGKVNYIVHRVRRGETLGAIARKYRTTIARIRANNNIDDPNMLRVGERLKIFLN
jgi:membrane-bound lytic murein transglycosylase D